MYSWDWDEDNHDFWPTWAAYQNQINSIILLHMEFREMVTTHIRHAEVQTRQNPWKGKWKQSLAPAANQKALSNWYQLGRENEFSSKDVTKCFNLWPIIVYQHKIDFICVHVWFGSVFAFLYWIFSLFLFWFSFLVVVIHFSLIVSFLREKQREIGMSKRDGGMSGESKEYD